MIRFCLFCILLSVTACKTTAPTPAGQYTIAIILTNNNEAINKAIGACAPLGPVNLEVLHEKPSGEERVCLTAKFFKKEDEVISKVRAELSGIKEVMSVQITPLW